MALTPEQVLNKHFQTTQFRRGYEERDVDDFLDEIVAEMRSLIEQRGDYLKQLNDCRASKCLGEACCRARRHPTHGPERSAHRGDAPIALVQRMRRAQVRGRRGHGEG